MDGNQPKSESIVSLKVFPNYNIGNFSNADTIAVLCRGNSLFFVKDIHNNFDYCFLVGQFDNGLKKIGKYIYEKKIVQILNKCSITPQKKLYQKYNIRDLQCNFGSYFGEPLSSEKNNLYKKISKINKWANVHLVPQGMTKRRPFKKWCTCGIYAIDLAAFFNPKNIIIIGLDFYCSKYFCREKITVSTKKNKHRMNEMISNFYALINRDKNIHFTIYTECTKLQNMENLIVKHV